VEPPLQYILFYFVLSEILEFPKKVKKKCQFKSIIIVLLKKKKLNQNVPNQTCNSVVVRKNDGIV